MLFAKPAPAWPSYMLPLRHTVDIYAVSATMIQLLMALLDMVAVGFYKAVWEFLFIIVIAAPLFALNDWLESRLIVEWRRWLTRQLLRGYFANRAFFRLHQETDTVDNPDQVAYSSSSTRCTAWGSELFPTSATP